MDAEKKGPRGPQYRNHVDGYRIAKKKRRFWGPTKKKEAKKVSANQWGGTTLCALLFVFFLRVCLLFFFERAAFCCFLEFVPFFFTEFYRVLLPPVPHWPIRHTHEKNGPKMRSERGACLTEFPRFGAFIFFFWCILKLDWIGNASRRIRFHCVLPSFTAFQWVLYDLYRVLLGFTGFY